MKSGRLTIALLFVLAWIMYLDRAAISSAKDLIAADLRLSDQTIGLVFGAFALGYAIAQVPSGWLADRFGPRAAIAGVVLGWSFFTGATGLVAGASTLIAVRFLFGMAEAGGFPGAARAIQACLPAGQHGRANGIVFAGSRLGAALSFPILSALVGMAGWRHTFVLLAFPGVLWAAIWLLRFRQDPHSVRQESPATDIPFRVLFRSSSVWLAMVQYFAGNFTFFVCLTWMYPLLVQHYALSRSEAAWCSSGILLVGATAHWVSGTVVDALYRRGRIADCRRVPAMAGFLIAAFGLTGLALVHTATASVCCFAVTAFGVEATISPSWAFCIALAGRKSGTISGVMNMAGNIGSFVSASVFPLLNNATGGPAAYFAIACGLNMLAVAVWSRMGRAHDSGPPAFQTVARS